MGQQLFNITFLQPPTVGQPALASVSEAPLSIWGPTDPRPSLPIHLPPGWASGNPPGIWGPTDPRPTPPISGLPGLPGYEPPIPQLPGFSAAWNIRESGAYFSMGPFAKPAALGENCNLDPAKTVWTPSMDGLGWTLLSGPYDKPFPVFGEDVPPVDPPIDPPVDPGAVTYSKWVYTEAAGWAFTTVTTFPGGKPRPPGGVPGGEKKK